VVCVLMYHYSQFQTINTKMSVHVYSLRVDGVYNAHAKWHLTSALSEQRMNVSTQCESEDCCANMRVKGGYKKGDIPLFWPRVQRPGHTGLCKCSAWL
jgi:hypothetical protein